MEILRRAGQGCGQVLGRLGPPLRRYIPVLRVGILRVYRFLNEFRIPGGRNQGPVGIRGQEFKIDIDIASRGHAALRNDPRAGKSVSFPVPQFGCGNAEHLVGPEDDVPAGADGHAEVVHHDSVALFNFDISGRGNFAAEEVSLLAGLAGHGVRGDLKFKAYVAPQDMEVVKVSLARDFSVEIAGVGLTREGVGAECHGGQYARPQ